MLILLRKLTWSNQIVLSDWTLCGPSWEGDEENEEITKNISSGCGDDPIWTTVKMASVCHPVNYLVSSADVLIYVTETNVDSKLDDPSLILLKHNQMKF